SLSRAHIAERASASSARHGSTPTGTRRDASPRVSGRRANPRVRPNPTRRRARTARIVGAAIHIDSAAELEPLLPDSPPERESGITSDPSDPPAWRRGDLEDFLL